MINDTSSVETFGQAESFPVLLLSLRSKTSIGIAAVLTALALPLFMAEAAHALADATNVKRDRSAFNQHFHLDGVDDYRVDADIAVLDNGMWKSVPSLNLVHRVDCSNPDPLAESRGQYSHPSSTDPDWRPNSRLNATETQQYGSYGCLENSGEPYPAQVSPTGGLHSIGVGGKGAMLDGARNESPIGTMAEPSLGGPGAGARIWSVKILTTTSGNFGEYVDPASFPVSLIGNGALNSFTTSAGTFTCQEGQLAGQMSQAGSKDLRFHASYDKCSALGLGAKVVMNSCSYQVEILNQGPPYVGTLSIVCDQPEDAVEYQAVLNGNTLCRATIAPQDDLGGIALSPAGDGDKRLVVLDAEVKGVQYVLTGSHCANGSHSDGIFQGEAEVLGSRSGDPGVGFTISGTGSAPLAIDQPRVAVEVEYLPQIGTAHVVAGLDWVTATREDSDPTNDIDVALMAIGCADSNHPVVQGSGIQAICNSTLLNEAIEDAIDHGIVPVVAAGNANTDTWLGTPRNNPNVLTVSSFIDTDGLPGGKGGTCSGSPEDTRKDDRRWDRSNFGPLVDIATQRCGGSTSGASGKASGAVAAVASQCPPKDRADVEFIIDTLMAEGLTGSVEEGGYEDDANDGWKEPVLDLGDEEVFDPRMVGEALPSDGCEWRSHQADSDVNGDGRADLVAVSNDGSGARVFAGEPSRFSVSNPVASLAGQIDPALEDGDGGYLVDTADVDGDRHADQVVATGGVGVHVHRGNEEGKFAPAVKAIDGITLAADGAPGTYEPIAVADVNGDERGDFVARTRAGALAVFSGQPNGTFGGPITSNVGADSALFDSGGNYFLDAIDVDGDGAADVVASNTNGTLYVYKAQAGGQFAAPIAAASLNPIMDDGQGAEPVGLGDVDRDRRADLLVLEGETLKLSKAQSDGTFSAPTTAYSGTVDSSLMDGDGQELIGLLDYSRDGLADLVAVTDEGQVLAYRAGRTFTFEAPVSASGSAPSVRHVSGGNEFVAEKPLARRLGCTASDCGWIPRRPEPLAAYSFDEGQGSIAHDSAGNHNGTVVGAQWSTVGKFGSALSFDGVDDLVTIADSSALDLTTSFTLSASVRPDSLPSWSPVFGKAETASTGSVGYMLSAKGPSNPTGQIANGETKGVFGTEALPTAAWSDLTVTFANRVFNLYVNGVLKKTTTMPIDAAPSAAALKVGFNQLLGTYFDGLIDEVRLYDVPLSAAQVAAARAYGR